LRWRGRTTGPFPVASIVQKLAGHEIGLYHEVQLDGEWMTVDAFLQRTGQAEPTRPAAGAVRLGRSPASPADESPAPIDLPGPAPAASFGGGLASAPGAAPTPIRVRCRTRSVYIALGLLLGFTGLHNLYAARPWRAGLQLALTALLFGLGCGLWITWLWACAETVLVVRDGRGQPLG
jgi:hypothetical protein